MAFRGASMGGGNWLTNVSSLSTIIFRVGGVISITLIIILITTFGSLVESVQQGSALPFIKTVGGKIMNYDTILYVGALDLEAAGGLIVPVAENVSVGFVAKSKYIFAVIGAILKSLTGLWYLYFFAFLFYKGAVLITNNSSAITSNVMIAVLGLVVLQIFANFVIVDSDIVGDHDFTTKQKMVPFKGTIKFGSVLPLVFNPIYERVSQVESKDEILAVKDLTIGGY